MTNARIHALAIYEILKNYSDENHILSNPKIITLLNQKYNFDLNQKTILYNIEALQQFGIDISTYSENRKGYYLRDHAFEDSELYLLCNCIHSSHFIPQKASQELIDKLNELQSKYKRREFSEKVYINNPRKTINKELILNIEILMEAINNKKSVILDYLTYNHKKELIPKRDKKYELLPYYILQENDNLYLLCKNLKYDDFSHYRIDKMKSISITERNVPSLKETFDPYVYSRSKKFMFSGKVEKIYLKCHKRMLDDLIDQFGHSIIINKEVRNDEYFFIRLESSTQGIIYFALQYLNYCEVLEPLHIKEEILQILKGNIKKYEN